MTFRYNRTPTGELPGNSLISQTEAALSALSKEATEAKEAAQAAQTAAEDAASQASAAASSAAASQAAAESAAQSAAAGQQALVIAQRAETASGQAVTTATAAATAAQASQTAAEDAASDAQDAADLAVQSAQDAQTAQGAASASQTAAESAQTSAGQAATIATQAQSAAAQSAQSAAEAAATVAASARQIGEIVTSTLPLSTVGLHLLDGAILDGDGIYAAFVEYVANLDQSANYFCTESEWQQSITDSGMCGKFVYDSVNETVRLPKLDGAVIQGDIDISTLGDLVAAGLDSSAPTQTVKSFIYIVIANSVASSTPVDLDEIVEKALDAVTITEDQTITSVKTFSSSPLVPTVSADDYSEKSANTAFVQTRIRKTADELQRQINALEGVVLTATDNTAVAYSKPIPTSANLFKYAAIRNFGGRSIVWNQIAQNNAQNGNVNGITFTNNGDGSWTVNGTATANAFWTTQTWIHKSIVGHKYLITGCPAGGAGNSYRLYFYPGGNVYDTGTGSIYEARSSELIAVQIQIESGLTVNNLVFKPRLRDLTLMFGAGKEPSTVEEFLAMFPGDDPAYSEGEIKSADVNKIVSADSESVEIDAKTIPQAILDLPGYGWSAGTAKNWVDWENKVYHQEVGQVDLGSLNWATADSHFYAWQLTGQKKAGQCVSAKYVFNANANIETVPLSINISHIASKVIQIYDSNYSTGADLKTALDGVMMNYELETPVITGISSLIDDNTIEVESGGSLTFENTNGDSYRIPVPSSVVTMEKP